MVYVIYLLQVFNSSWRSAHALNLSITTNIDNFVKKAERRKMGNKTAVTERQYRNKRYTISTKRWLGSCSCSWWFSSLAMSAYDGRYRLCFMSPAQRLPVVADKVTGTSTRSLPLSMIATLGRYERQSYAEHLHRRRRKKDLASALMIERSGSRTAC